MQPEEHWFSAGICAQGTVRHLHSLCLTVDPGEEKEMVQIVSDRVVTCVSCLFLFLPVTIRAIVMC